MSALAPEAARGDLEFGLGLERIGAIVVFLRALRDQDAAAMMSVLDPEISVGPLIGVTPAQGYEGREAALDFFAEARRNGVRIEPDPTGLSVTETGAIVGTGRLRLKVAGAVELAPAKLLYEFRGTLIASISGDIDEV